MVNEKLLLSNCCACFYTQTHTHADGIHAYHIGAYCIHICKCFSVCLKSEFSAHCTIKTLAQYNQFTIILLLDKFYQKYVGIGLRCTVYSVRVHTYSYTCSGGFFIHLVGWSWACHSYRYRLKSTLNAIKTNYVIHMNDDEKQWP